MVQRVNETGEARAGATSWDKRLALAASILFHPALLPTQAFATLLFGGYLQIGFSPTFLWWLLALLSCLTLVLPMAMLGMAHYFGLVTDWQLRPKSDRLFSLWLLVAIYGAGTATLYKHLPSPAFHLMAGIAFLALLTAIVNLFYRLSGHALALAAFLGYWGSLAAQTGNSDYLFPLVATLLATGVGVWARLTLKAHTIGQVLWGLGLGLISGIGVAYWPY